MKKRLPSFLAGMLCAALLGGLTVSALAITGKTTIEVYPINVMVNGEVFQPTDAQGHPVDVFTYKGTTYAPLRALAEAYGLEVGYDAEAKLATVTDPSRKTPEQPEKPEVPDYSDWSTEKEVEFQKFASKWTINEDKHWSDSSDSLAISFEYDAIIDRDAFNSIEMVDEFAKRFAVEQYDGEEALVVILFSKETKAFLRIIGMKMENGELQLSGH